MNDFHLPIHPAELDEADGQAGEQRIEARYADGTVWLKQKLMPRSGRHALRLRREIVVLRQPSAIRSARKPSARGIAA
jgi:hypothetical protein